MRNMMHNIGEISNFDFWFFILFVLASGVFLAHLFEKLEKIDNKYDKEEGKVVIAFFFPMTLVVVGVVSYQGLKWVINGF
jgi:hypothetical protein